LSSARTRTRVPEDCCWDPIGGEGDVKTSFPKELHLLKALDCFSVEVDSAPLFGDTLQGGDASVITPPVPL
jgi:hypothetical protein